MSSPFNRIGCSPYCKGLPSILSSSCLPCAVLISTLSLKQQPQSLKGANICLPPIGVARINKLQSTLKNLDKIHSDRLKYYHDHKYHFQMPQLQGQESRSGNPIQASHMECYCQAKELHFDI